MPHCGEHIPDGRSDSGRYRLSGGRRTHSATVAVATTNAATARRATAKAASTQRRQPVAHVDERRLQRDDGERGRSGTSWSHDDDDTVESVPTDAEDDELRILTTVAARRLTLTLHDLLTVLGKLLSKSNSITNY